MRLVIDTFNVLHVTGVLPPDLAGIDVRGLADLLLASRYRRARTVLVCDGSPSEDAPAGRVGGIRVLHAGPGVEADTVIARIVEKSTSPRRLLVISSDRMVRRTARRRRCRVLDSRRFLHHLAEDHRRESGGPSNGPALPAGSVLPMDVVREAAALWAEAARSEAPDPAPDPTPQAPGAGRAEAPDEAAAPGPERVEPRSELEPPEATGDTGLLPADLVAEAEALWQRARRAEERTAPPRENADDAGDGRSA